MSTGVKENLKVVNLATAAKNVFLSFSGSLLWFFK